tara:strand:+ start:97 stop:288 length:192 start_codon:yes stop_codon:yes gene_type:complete
MSKLILLFIGYVSIFLLIIAFYKVNNLRIPFSNWGGWKKDVKLKERLIVSFVIQIPLFILVIL